MVCQDSAGRRAPSSYLPLYLVTDTALCSPRSVPDVVALAVGGGATCVQVRDKAAGGRALVELLVAVADAVDGRVPVLVDDRVDVYLAARARGARVDGVHVGQSDLPADLVRQIVGPHAVVGLSAATPEEFRRAAALPPGTVDYLGVGAVYATSTKPDHPVPLGLEGFAALLASAPLPSVAIGGLSAVDAAELRRAGAAGMAVVSAVCAAADPAAAARDLIGAWNA
ncbi:thiamine phosphate synthase [Arthrobacter agilis]|uniref:thiamine phosphate synthase n=1 Tax=Arthrobacter agilis TaxID=37921 RepID=UPI000B359185|nr:thiamine phosphate synthase [Arthrobacter agilis]OUM45050.1 thiamine-phosphate diphosphorylase [Arthrobacter agilis]PPB46884.1 thiamine phosphate synthase [Arthrobacter agilis]TPV23525.1 thiamine phosphate synthase [Arthrobacter agilis]VDR31923.1 Thiamine-phosphate synthase [Arthrobacter agilis]